MTIPSRETSASVGHAHGTFGELLQGIIGPEEEKFLVTMPIRRGSTVCYEYLPTATDLVIEPAHKTKSLTMARRVLAAIDKPQRGSLRVQSSLPEGKGMASSSADMIATARAILSYWQSAGASRSLLAMLACEIEPTDGVMYEGHVAFAHCSGRLLRRFEGDLPLIIVAHDEGGSVDTVAYNSEARRRTTGHEAYTCLLAILEHAFHRRDRRTLGWISTLSAIFNQELLPKATLRPMLDISRANGALGVVVAHSGTCIGILIDPEEPSYLDTCANVSKDMRSLGLNPWIEESAAQSASGFQQSIEGLR